MTIFELWLVTTVLPGIGCIASTAAFILAAAIVVITLYSAIQQSCSKDYPELEASKREAARAAAGWRHNAKLIRLLVVFGILAAICPSERQMLLIGGGYAATNNAEIAKLPTNAAKAVNAWLDAVSAAQTGKEQP